MYEIIKQCINAKTYDLNVIIYKIDSLWVEQKITDEQREELKQLARENANPENSYTPKIDQLEERIIAIEKKMEELINGPDQPTEPETPNEYPEYIQPTGAHNAYHVGDKITYDGKKYECISDGCVWNPDDYPQGWKLVE